MKTHELGRALLKQPNIELLIDDEPLVGPVLELIYRGLDKTDPCVMLWTKTVHESSRRIERQAPNVQNRKGQ